MKRLLLLLSAVISLTGCPEVTPPTGIANNHPGTPDEPGGAPAPGGGPNAAQGPTDAPGNAAGVGEATTGGGLFATAVSDSERVPEFTQDALKNTDAVTISGQLLCSDCAGKLLVRVLPPPPDVAGGGPPEIMLITMKQFDGEGDFEMLVPKSHSPVVLQVVDDADSDGQPSAGERMGMPASGPLDLSGKTSGLSLTVGTFPAAPAVDPIGNPMTEAPEGGPATTPGPDAAAAGAGAAPQGAPDGATPPPAGEPAQPPTPPAEGTPAPSGVE